MSDSEAALLIVDDIEDNRFALSRRLARQGYLNVTTAVDGRQALELLKSKPFDLVLLDIMMPQVNGYEVLAQMKADERLRHIPVIMISAVDEIDSVVRCIELGADDYLAKPFNPTLLRARVGACLERKRLHDELRESLQQQTATADVLKVISRSTFDLQTVLDTLVETAARLCDARRAVIFKRDGDSYHGVAFYNSSPENVDFVKSHPITPGRHTIGARVALERRIVQVADVQADPDYRYVLRDVDPIRTVLGVPMFREDDLIGIVVLYKLEVQPFTDKQIELVTTFADQAVIAIENVRLFEAEQQRTQELAESLEQQTATSDVLRVISSSPGDLAPVFDAMLKKATQLCGAGFGTLWIYDGERFSAAATHALPAALAEFVRKPVPAAASASFVDIVRGQDLVHLPDLAATELYHAGNRIRRAFVDLGGARTMISVALRKDNVLLGALNVYRQKVRPFSDKETALVRSFAAQAVIAIENARLLSELRQRTDDL